jgi:hypothetical protein
MSRPRANLRPGFSPPLHEMKRGELKSGGSGTRVRSRKQAIAIGLSEARKAGSKVPVPPATSSR